MVDRPSTTTLCAAVDPDADDSVTTTASRNSGNEDASHSGDSTALTALTDLTAMSADDPPGGGESEVDTLQASKPHSGSAAAAGAPLLNGCAKNKSGGAASTAAGGKSSAASTFCRGVERRPGDTLDSVESKTKEDEMCGWGAFRPRCFQVFRNAKVVLFFLCLVATIQGMVINGFVSVVISTIERRFDLASKESGFIASGYDIASVLCLIPVSYFGGVGHKPRWIAGGVLLISLGSFLFAMPHFIADFYKFESPKPDDWSTCHASVSAGSNSSVLPLPGGVGGCRVSVDGPVTVENWRPVSSMSGYMFVMVVAQMLHGAGGTPIYTLAVTYLDESLKSKVAPLYLGIFYTTAIIGPAIGYIAGGKLLEIYCDIGSVDMDDINLTPSDSQWIGAWWIGFLISGSLSFLIAIPLSAFPKSIPVIDSGRPTESDSEVQRGCDDSPANPGFRVHFREIPSSLKSLLCNPTFMCVNIAGAFEGMLVSGFIVFAPKFVESQFSISAAWAAQLIGFATIPSGGGGTFVGGYIVKRFNLRCRGILRLCILTTFLALALSFMLLIRCENVPFAGVNVDLITHNRTKMELNLTSTCNFACQCASDVFEPVCGADNLIYFSPCFAGCTSTLHVKGSKVYSNCSCVEPDVLGSRIAYEGKCLADCQLLSVFLVLFALLIFITFTTSMPALAATLRCVPEQQRSFALGIQWILFRTLGMIPAPILFGVLIDQACISWQSTACDSGEKGSCLMYDNYAMGSYLLGLIFICKSLVFGFFIAAYLCYRPQVPPPDVVVEVKASSAVSHSATQCTVSELEPMAAKTV